MNTVLVLTGRSDITADAVVDELTRRRASVVRYDTKDFPGSSKVAATLGSQGWRGTLSGDHRVELESISSVWWRRPGEFAIPPDWRGARLSRRPSVRRPARASRRISTRKRLRNVVDAYVHASHRRDDAGACPAGGYPRARAMSAPKPRPAPVTSATRRLTMRVASCA
jgi:hypothetical protein